jgi:putative PIN family toxin of toxin-antitoxin system
MSQISRVVLDTNVVVSGILFPGSVPEQALLKAQTGIVLATDIMRSEVIEVLARSKFERYVSREIRRGLGAQFLLTTTEVFVHTPIRVCRDRRDDKFLEAAVHGRADAIITGDLDLLALDPFDCIRILTPAAILDLQAPGSLTPET